MTLWTIFLILVTLLKLHNFSTYDISSGIIHKSFIFSYRGVL
jgi:hypothetical protein